MIIKVTLNDNDYTSFIESYFEMFAFKNYYYEINRNYRDSENPDILRQYVNKKIEAEELLKKAFYKEHEMTESDKSIFIDIIKNSLSYYIFDKTDAKYIPKLKGEIEVELLEVTGNKDMNGEVVFYFLQQGKYITC